MFIQNTIVERHYIAAIKESNMHCMPTVCKELSK